MKTKKSDRIKKVIKVKTEKAEKPAKRESEVKSKRGGLQKIGIIASIIESIREGWKTKDEILAVLIKKFPDRKAEGMKSTISIQLGPTRLGAKYNLKKDGDKFQIDGA